MTQKRKVEVFIRILKLWYKIAKLFQLCDTKHVSTFYDVKQKTAQTLKTLWRVYVIKFADFEKLKTATLSKGSA